MIEELKKSRYSLRRYSEGRGCGGRGYHDARSSAIAETDDDPTKDYHCTNPPEKPAPEDPRWPTKCEHCEYVFTAEDHFQVFGSPLYKRADTGQVMTRDEAPAGAMWYADWYRNFYEPGPDGKWLCVKLPDGTDWCVDSEASNCTRKGDKTHHCWIREGTPPLVTAGKSGNTCSAGAGSIATPGYHGFLRSGYLEQC